MKVTVYETVTESFTLEVPADVVAEGPDAIEQWIEGERVDNDHPRAFVNVNDVYWEPVA